MNYGFMSKKGQKGRNIIVGSKKIKNIYTGIYKCVCMVSSEY